jgi:hypothetical protein
LGSGIWPKILSAKNPSGRQRKALFVHIIGYLDNESSGRRMEAKKDGL